MAALTFITTLGVFFKESAVMVVGVMGLYDLTWRLERKDSTSFHYLMSAIAAALTSALAWLLRGPYAALGAVILWALVAGLLVVSKGVRSIHANLWGWFWTGYVAVLPPLVAVILVRAWVFGHMRPAEFPFVDNPMVSVALEYNSNYYNLPIHNSLHNWLVCTLTAIRVLGEYFRLLTWPRILCCDYSYNQIPLVDLRFRSFEDWKAILALVLVLAVIALAVRQYRRNPAVFFFILFFFVTLLPTSNLIIVNGCIMAERFLYLPSIGFAGCVVMAVDAICRRLFPQPDSAEHPGPHRAQVASICVLSVMTIACGIRAFVRNFDWDDDVALWTAAAKVCPNSFKTHKSLAYAYYEIDTAKTPPAYPDIDRIIDEGEKAVAVTDQKPLPPALSTSIVYLHLGVYLPDQGRRPGTTSRPRGAVADEGGAALVSKIASNSSGRHSA